MNEQDEWMKLERYYVAQGSESYLTVGNFDPNELTDTLFNSQNPLFSGGSQGSYIYIDSVVVEEVPFATLPELGLRDTALCPGEELDLSGLLPSQAVQVWNNLREDTAFVIDSAGTYWVDGYYGCAHVTDTIRVSYYEEADIALTTRDEDTTLCGEEALVLDGSAGGSLNTYIWQNGGQTTPTVTVTESALYEVDIRNPCAEGVSRFEVDFIREDVTDHNIITPNEDGVNDELRFYFREQPDDAAPYDYRVEVYNRWGRKVWESDDETELWKAEGLNDGMYFYQVHYTDCKGNTQQQKGTVEVRR